MEYLAGAVIIASGIFALVITPLCLLSYRSDKTREDKEKKDE